MSTNANAAQHNFYYTLEGSGGTNHGVTPTGATTWKRLRLSGLPTLNLGRGKLQSKELKGNRIQGDVRLGSHIVNGELPVEALYDTPFMGALEATLCSTWSTPAAAMTANTISASNDPSKFLFAGDNAPVVVPGDLIYVSGFTTPANNGVFQVLDRAAGYIEVTSAYVLEIEAAGDTVTVEPMAKLVSGVTRRSFSMMKHFADLDSSKKPYHVSRGCEFKSVTLNFKPEELVAGSFGVIGCDSLFSETVPTGFTAGTASTVKPMDNFAGAVIEGDALSTQSSQGIIVEGAITFDNGHTPRMVIGSKTSLEYSIGVASLSGNIKLWFEGAEFLDKFLNEEETAFIISTSDPAGNVFAIELPRVLILEAPITGDGALMLDIPLAMQEHGTYGSHIRIWRN